MNVVLPFPSRQAHAPEFTDEPEPTALQHAIDQENALRGDGGLVPGPVLALLHNSVAGEPARTMVAAAIKSWMAGTPLTARDQRIVDVVCDTNYATQIGRLCLPYS